jgi:hypothetical protein
MDAPSRASRARPKASGQEGGSLDGKVPEAADFFGKGTAMLNLKSFAFQFFCQIGERIFLVFP